MKNADISRKEVHGRLTQLDRVLDPQVILSLLVKNWYYFFIATALALFIARFYINHTMRVFRVSSSIVIKKPEDRASLNNDQFLQGLGLPGAMNNLENQIILLKSRSLTERVLNSLPFEMEFYYKTTNNQIPVYPDIPVKIIPDYDLPLPENIEFSIASTGNNMFILKSENENFTLEKEAIFGDTIYLEGNNIRIECNKPDWFNDKKDKKLYFVISNKTNLIRYFNSRIEIEPLTDAGSVLRISLAGTNLNRDVDFLNKLIEVFQTISIEKKNSEASRRIQFIDDQLTGISDSLLITENRLQQFRSTHRVMDLSSQGQNIISQVTNLESVRARLNLEANYYDYLAEYLNMATSGEAPIIPITMGITDPGLTRLVAELADLQTQLSSKGAGEKNPMQTLLLQRINSSKNALRETLNGLRRANSIARSDNQQQINKVNTQAAALPATERQLLGIERKFRLNDELYTFLLQTRSEQLMQKASNMADSEVIDPASAQYSSVISPNAPRVYLVGLFAGFSIPFLIIFLIFLFNNKLKYEDIARISDLPVIGNIPHNPENKNTVILDYPNSAIAESFRLLRSRMQFLTKEARSSVILVTSSMPGDGKTFVAINLASVYSLLGKKTILIGFDLRKPKIFMDFKIENDKGISTWLIGKDNLEDVIQETSFNNLSIIPAGPIPPNPSELTALGKTNELINLLKERYSFIVVDSSPIGIVSETYHLASLSDASLVIVRPGKTLRDIFATTLHEINSAGIKGVSLVINDIKANKNHYGEKYGYTSVMSTMI